MKATTDPQSGYCSETKTFHSLRPSVPLPPESLPLSFPSFALSLLLRHSPPSPSTPAFIFPSSISLSFSDFLSLSSSLSVSLRVRLRLSKGDVAFILSPLRLEIPVLLFSLLEIGAVLTPSNPLSSPSDISRQIRLSRPKIAFATSSTAASLPPDLPVVLIDSDDFRSMFVGGGGGGGGGGGSESAADRGDPAIRYGGDSVLLRDHREIQGGGDPPPELHRDGRRVQGTGGGDGGGDDAFGASVSHDGVVPLFERDRVRGDDGDGGGREVRGRGGGGGGGGTWGNGFGGGADGFGGVGEGSGGGGDCCGLGVASEGFCWRSSAFEGGSGAVRKAVPPRAD
ncbi:4-coumarate--CoA ligase-like 7 [Acorus calamus]|uniref:4-coumarate--CoA ligase-like 7 n=1 Tax=Acorus calamus TaxID=4465 RepID=A0AAV9CPD2_ACOCL|nr:4-coumarate--CoA ligase-like 7 [Acorus calamus]